MKRQFTLTALAAAMAGGAFVLADVRAKEPGRRAPSGVRSQSQAVKPQGAKTSPMRPTLAASTAQPAFDGKLIAISLRGSQQPKLLEQARFVEIKGRTFLVGKGVRATLSFPIGANANVAWDAIDAFYVFDSVEQYETALHETLQRAGDSIETVLDGVFPVQDDADGKSRSFEPSRQAVPQYYAPDARSQYSRSIPEPADTSEAQGEVHIVRDPNGHERRVRILRGQDGQTEIFVEEQLEEVKTPQSLPSSQTPTPIPAD